MATTNEVPPDRDTDATPPPKISHRTCVSPGSGSNGEYEWYEGLTFPSKRKKSPYAYAMAADVNKIVVSLRDDRYNAIIMKYTETLDAATIRADRILDEKIRPEANEALSDLHRAGGFLLNQRVSSWRYPDDLSEKECNEAALKRIITDLRTKVYSRRKHRNNVSEKADDTPASQPPTKRRRKKENTKRRVKLSKGSLNLSKKRKLFLHFTDSSDEEDTAEEEAEEEEEGVTRGLEDQATKSSKDSIENSSAGRRRGADLRAHHMGETEEENKEEEEGVTRGMEEQANNIPNDSMGNASTERRWDTLLCRGDKKEESEEDSSKSKGEEGATRGMEGQVNNNSRDSVETVSVTRQGQENLPSQTREQQNESQVGQDENPLIAVEREEGGENETQANDEGQLTFGRTMMSGSSKDCEADDAEETTTGTDITQSGGASSWAATGPTELELGRLYKTIKRRLARSKTRDGKVFYGLLKKYFSRKMRYGDLLSPTEINKVNHFVSRFESNVECLNHEGNDYDDLCVYGGFIKYILSECQKELGINTP